jgi:class 3 adenylate cyclase
LLLFKPIVLVLRLGSIAALLVLPMMLGIAVLPVLEGPGSYPWVNRVIAFDASIMASIRAAVPTQLGQLDIARALLMLAAFIVAGGLDVAGDRLSALTSTSALQRRLGRLRKSAKQAHRQSSLAPIEAKLQQLKPGDKKSRAELVRLMVQAKRELDAMTEEVAFLALDVVESTNMKLGEDSAFVEHDFREFKKMVESAIGKQRPLKSAWTPDGAMICFDSLERAVKAAQEMLRKLPDFNTNTRMMSTPFRVRCGVNAGAVQYDPTTPMEEMSDNVIDVAGHMQKYAEPDTIFLAGDLVRKKRVARGFAESGTEVDGYATLVWRGPSADPWVARVSDDHTVVGDRT